MSAPSAATVNSTNVKNLPVMGGLSFSVFGENRAEDIYPKVESGWFKNTWNEENGKNAVELFPYKLLQIEGTTVKNSFTLPISPQQLNISTPFAIVTTPTLNGIVEEHNSVRFKDIEIAGTMGVFPADRDRDFSSISWRIFDPTGFIDSADSIAASIPLIQLMFQVQELLVDPAQANSGYANLHRLRIFLESYAEQKKTNKSLRLIFASYKDNQYYYVTPASFSVRRSASNPMEYEYSLAMRSWGAYDPSVKTDIYHNSSGVSVLAVGAIAATLLASYTAFKDSVVSVWKGNLTEAYKSGAIWSVIGDNLFANKQNALIDLLNNGIPVSVEEVSNLASKTSEASTTLAGSFNMNPRVLPFTNPHTGLPTVVPPSPNIQQTPPSPEQMETLFTLNDLKINLDHLQRSVMGDASTQANPLDYVAGLASKSGIAFQTSVSKYPVSFPANATLEHMSAQYLNDPNRWIEIATLNGLQAPYVDNRGFDVPFLFDGAKNKVIIHTNALNIGKSVTLSSRTQPRKTYGVVSYIQNGYYYEVTLDNDPYSKLPNSSNYDDLSRYKVADLATLHYYTPNTVRAGQIIYIPSEEPSNINEFNTNQIPSLKQFQEEIRVSGVDLLLQSTSADDLEGTVQRVSSTLDLVIQDNDAALSHGITNLKQSLYLILFTPQGSILQHPNFGIGSVTGQSNADVNFDSFNQSIKNAILQDKSFSDVEFITSSLNGPVLTINLGVRIAQLNKVLPISFDINLKGA